MKDFPEIQVQTLNHLGIIAGIIDEIGLVEEINRLVGTHPKEIVSAGQVVKAMILNGLGFVSAPLYLFHKFFEGKATEHLIGKGVRAEHLNDDRLGRVLDQIYVFGLTRLFVSIAHKAAVKFGIATDSLHLDSSSFHVHGEYLPPEVELSVEVKSAISRDGEKLEALATKPVEITQGYSRDHRPDLKQFIIDLICSGDGDVPLYLRVADGNEADKAVFAQLIQEFQQQLSVSALFVADSALYSEDNLKSLSNLRWISRVPLTITQAKQLVNELKSEEFVNSVLEGYRIAECNSNYGGIEQRWVIVESQARSAADIKQLHNQLDKLDAVKSLQLQQLCRQEFQCEPDALQATERFAKKLKYHCLEAISVVKQTHYSQPGRPRKDTQPQVSYQVRATLVRNQATIEQANACSGRFILATNVTEKDLLSAEQVLQEYKEQQSPERGFRFLKDPLFFTSSVFVKSPERVAAIACIMGLCLLVYSLGQRVLRQALSQAGESIKNQVGLATERPTLRWVFQCFQDVHLLLVNGMKQIANLTQERRWILRFLGAACGQYYLLD